MAVVALLLIPALYGGLYLYANHDPYANLKNVPAALVVEDQGARDSDGNDVNAGREVAEELLAGKSFDWQQTDAADAATGLGPNETTATSTRLRMARSSRWASGRATMRWRPQARAASRDVGSASTIRSPPATRPGERAGSSARRSKALLARRAAWLADMSSAKNAAITGTSVS